ncbi:MAG TPA: ferredoxin [Campylobacterales bacterium]|nr:ferredoxin [Campylobacterales bacterium]
MALVIIDTCICCDACVTVCPTDAISCDDPIYLIDASCVECEGFFDSPECIRVCPVDCIIKKED